MFVNIDTWDADSLPSLPRGIPKKCESPGTYPRRSSADTGSQNWRGCWMPCRHSWSLGVESFAALRFRWPLMRLRLGCGVPGRDAKKEKTSARNAFLYQLFSWPQVMTRSGLQKNVALLDVMEPSSLQSIVRLKCTYWLVRSLNLKLTDDN